jgi:hypothetical protein
MHATPVELAAAADSAFAAIFAQRAAATNRAQLGPKFA